MTSSGTSKLACEANRSVSIILTTQNGSRTLPRTLRSIESQTYKNFELIIIDNNSSDGSKELLDEYAEVHNCSGGMSAQINLGLSLAHGDFILLLEQDHFAASELLERCVKSSNLNNYDAIVIPETREGSYWVRCRVIEVGLYKYTGDVAARFFKSSLLSKMNWFDVTLSGFRDYDFGHKMRQVTSNYGSVDSFIRTTSNDSLADYVRKFFSRGSSIVDLSQRYGIAAILQPYLHIVEYFAKNPKNRDSDYLFGFLILKFVESVSIVLSIFSRSHR